MTWRKPHHPFKTRHRSPDPDQRAKHFANPVEQYLYDNYIEINDLKSQFGKGGFMLSDGTLIGLAPRIESSGITWGSHDDICIDLDHRFSIEYSDETSSNDPVLALLSSTGIVRFRSGGGETNITGFPPFTPDQIQSIRKLSIENESDDYIWDLYAEGSRTSSGSGDWKSFVRAVHKLGR